MARKTAKEYRVEYNALNRQQNALEARIRKRLETLCKQHPDVKTGSVTFAEDIEPHINRLSVDGMLIYIEKIESELAKRDKYVQARIQGF